MASSQEEFWRTVFSLTLDRPIAPSSDSMRASLLMVTIVVLLATTKCQASLRLRRRTQSESDSSTLGSGGSTLGIGSSNVKTRDKNHDVGGQQTRKRARCEDIARIPCGQGLGYLICEYSDEEDVYATRCVRENKLALHLKLHPNNYCGTCHRCFEDSEELREAVEEYIANSTRYTTVAQHYGWPINEWCVSQISDFSNLFANQRKFKDSIADWDVSQAVNMSGMFQSAFVFNSDLSNWNTTNVRDMSRMFDCAYTFNMPLVSWDTQKVNNMSRMFRVAKAFNQDLSSWDTGRVHDMSYMFYRAHSFDQPVMKNIPDLQDMSYMFAFARRFNQSNVKDWDVSGVQTMRGAFQNTGNFDQDVSQWKTNNLVDASFMFYRASAFQDDSEKQKAIVASWDLSNVNSLQNMFSEKEAALNATVVSQEGAAMLSHPSYDGSRVLPGMELTDVSSSEIHTSIGEASS